MEVRHPKYPASNVAKFSGYDADKYDIVNVSRTFTNDECMACYSAPYLTQHSIAKYLVPLSKELIEVPLRPTISELPDAVIDHVVLRDKAFWVDKPGLNDYTIHEAYYNYGMVTEVVKPTHQDVFPRSYQYDLDCVKYRRTHACDGLKQDEGEEKKKPPSAHCRDCRKNNVPALTTFQLAWVEDPGQKRWKNYPELTETLTPQEIRESMKEVGRPFRNEACNWYYKNYPPVKYDCIIRKFSK